MEENDKGKDPLHSVRIAFCKNCILQELHCARIAFCNSHQCFSMLLASSDSCGTHVALGSRESAGGYTSSDNM